MALGEIILSPRLHQRMQFDRWHIGEFIRREAVPLMKPGMVVLDAGSGHLSEQQFRRDYLATGVTLHTCDFSPGPGVDYVADVSALPFADASYDIVISTQVLEHVQDPKKVVEEMARVLKPGGYLFLTTPQSSPLHNLPWNYFNSTNIGLRLLFEKAGLTVVKEEPQGGHFTVVAYNLHFTVQVIRRSKLPGWVKKPLEMVCRVLFGFVFKLPLLWLDRIDKEPLNTLGWDLAGRKPG